MARAVDNRVRVAATAALLFCFALFLTTYSAKNPKAARIGATIAQELLYPFQLLSSNIYGSTSGVWSGYLFLVGVQKENETLRQRVAALEAQNATLMETAHENERLRGLLLVKEESKLNTVAAKVIGYDPSNWIEALSINVGSQHGIREGMAVLASNGVVGQTIAVAAFSSKVLLITDHSSGLDALIQGTRARGIVEGAGQDSCAWRFVTAPEEVKVGDKLVSSGADGVYPKGLLVGLVTEVDDRGRGLSATIRVAPAQALDKLESVLVVTSVGKGAN